MPQVTVNKTKLKIAMEMWSCLANLQSTRDVWKVVNLLSTAVAAWAGRGVSSEMNNPALFRAR